MKKNIKNILVFVFILIIIAILFIELFIHRVITSNIKLIELLHYENRADILTFINIIVTSVISLNVYYLSKRINEQNNIEKNRKRYEAICTVYDYLIEVIDEIKKKVFQEKEDYHVLKYKDNFMQSVYNLNNDLFDERDIYVLRNFDQQLKIYLNSSNITNGKLSIKWVYKSLFDLNISINKLKEISDLVDMEFLLNLEIINIISKLKKELKYNYCKNIEYENMQLKIYNINNKIIVKKNYDDENEIINGCGTTKIHEPVFYIDRNTYGDNIIYEGEIKHYEPNGIGIYYYYKANGDDVFINSDDLIDKNAKRVKKILENKSINTRCNALFDGIFENGFIKNGVIKSKDKEFEDITY